MKIVYIAATRSLPQEKITDFLGNIAKDCMGSEPIDGYFFAPQCITAQEEDYASKIEADRAYNLVNFSRKFDEIWLVGPEVLTDEDFDQEFRLEMRCVRTDWKPMRRFRIKV